MNFTAQMRSVIQWENPQEYQLFYKFTDKGDELKNASKLIVQPGQGCIFTYEGKIEGLFDEEGIYDLKTANKPFVTTIKKFLNAFESEHKTGLWFYKKADMLNVRWGTRIPITYNDPIYSFPVNLKCYGNYSLRITEPQNFFINVIGGKNNYFVDELQEILLSRITQPISNYLANAKFSYADVDSNMVRIAEEAKEKTSSVFNDLGFELTDFRIEGTSFDEATQERIGRIANVNADVQAAKLAGLDYAQMEQLKAMRDAAKNEGGITGLGAGMGAGMQIGNMMMGNQNTQPQNTQPQNTDDPMAKLKKLKEMFEMELITENEYATKKQEILDTL